MPRRLGLFQLRALRCTASTAAAHHRLSLPAIASNSYAARQISASSHTCSPSKATTASQSTPTSLSSASSSSRASASLFDDPSSAYESKTISDLLRAKLVFGMSSMPFLVDNAEKLLKSSYSIAGPTVTNFVLRQTFFGHFCAGETEKDIKPRIDMLHSYGVGGILDYAAEADLESHKANPQDTAKKFVYKGEDICEVNKKIFLDCITAVQNVTPEGFAAIKLTALGEPELIQRVSDFIVVIREVFAEMDKDNSGTLTRQEFDLGYSKLFDTDQNPDDLARWTEFVNTLCHDNNTIDYIEWTNSLKLDELNMLLRDSIHPRLHGATLTEEEQKKLSAMRGRVEELARAARDKEVRLMIDAEQTYFQPLIDGITLSLQSVYNKDFPSIFNTYQCYLKDSKQRIQDDLERAKRGNYFFAAKLVRGAYVVSERELAEKKGYESPIHNTKEDTDKNYDECVRMVLEQHTSGANVMIASHNQQSIEHTVDSMQELGIKRTGNVHFGQLLGMADHLTFTLGMKGYKAYKYVPYGPIQEVVPYLVRRAQENSGVLGQASDEQKLLNSVLKKRLRGNKD